MAPHLVRAQSAYKDKDTLISTHTRIHTRTHARTRTHTHTHTHSLSLSLSVSVCLSHTHTHIRTDTTNTCITDDGFIQWQENDSSVCSREEMGFHFWLKRREWRHNREFQITDPMYWKDLTPRGPLPIQGTWTIQASESKRRDFDWFWLIDWLNFISQRWRY